MKNIDDEFQLKEKIRIWFVQTDLVKVDEKRKILTNWDKYSCEDLLKIKENYEDAIKTSEGLYLGNEIAWDIELESRNHKNNTFWISLKNKIVIILFVISILFFILAKIWIFDKDPERSFIDESNSMYSWEFAKWSCNTIKWLSTCTEFYWSIREEKTMKIFCENSTRYYSDKGKFSKDSCPNKNIIWLCVVDKWGYLEVLWIAYKEWKLYNDVGSSRIINENKNACKEWRGEWIDY